MNLSACGNDEEPGRGGGVHIHDAIGPDLIDTDYGIGEIRHPNRNPLGLWLFCNWYRTYGSELTYVARYLLVSPVRRGSASQVMRPHDSTGRAANHDRG